MAKIGRVGLPLLFTCARVGEKGSQATTLECTELRRSPTKTRGISELLTKNPFFAIDECSSSYSRAFNSRASLHHVEEKIWMEPI